MESCVFADYVKNKKRLNLMFYGILLMIIAISTFTVQLIQCHDKVCERTSRSKVSLGPGIFPIHFFKRWITPDVLLIKKIFSSRRSAYNFKVENNLNKTNYRDKLPTLNVIIM